MEEWPPTWKVAVNILNKQSRTADKGWPSSLGVGRCSKNFSPQKRYLVTKCSCRKPWMWTDTSVQPKQRSFRKWDVGAWTGLSWLRIRTGGRHL